MKKIKSFIYDNWLFVVLLLPFILICINNRLPDNDIWFLLNNGRYLINNGIPNIDPFTIHDGLEYVMQQWGSSLLFWELYDIFGSKVLLVFIYIISFLLMFVFYKICYIVSEKKKISIVITCITFVFITDFIVLRPQVISYLFLLLEILCLELYIKKKKYLYLLFLPLLSFLLINFHASMWYFQFIFLLPFICNGICLEKIKCLSKYKIDKYKLLPILVTMVFMILVGFINPYGVDAITFVFKSYGVELFNSEISEMNPWSLSGVYGIPLLVILLSLFVGMFLKKDLRLDIRNICFICGAIILGFMHTKCFSWFVILIMYSVAYMFRTINFKINVHESIKKYLKALYDGLVISSCLFGIITFAIVIYYSYGNYEVRPGSLGMSFEEITKYVLDNYDKEKVVLYVDFNNGGYTEFMGLKSYIDGRAELFIKEVNGKSDIFEEHDRVQKGNIDFDYFVNKYNFTHIMVYTGTVFDKYLSTSEDYIIVYNDTSFIDEDGEGALNLYVHKDVEVLK